MPAMNNSYAILRALKFDTFPLSCSARSWESILYEQVGSPEHVDRAKKPVVLVAEKFSIELTNRVGLFVK